MASAGSATLTTTMGMIHWIHYDASNLRSAAQPSGTSGLPEGHVHVILVADFADCCATPLENHAHLAGWEPHRYVVSLFRDNRRTGSGGTHELATATVGQFYVVHDRAEGYSLQR
jgi:hypothetical protein